MQFTLSHLSRFEKEEEEGNCSAQYAKSIKINQAGVDNYYSEVYEFRIYMLQYYN